MQASEVLECLSKVDSFVEGSFAAKLSGRKVPFQIIGKSALYLSGIDDPAGTNDIDSLQLEGRGLPEEFKALETLLKAKFGRKDVLINGFYLEFLKPSFAFLPNQLTWLGSPENHETLEVKVLEPNAVCAVKLFSAFGDHVRKKDLQDITRALDQGLVKLQSILDIADAIFDEYHMDARSEHFPRVYQYIEEELIPNYGPARLKYLPTGE